MRRQTFEIVDINCGDHRAPGEIADRDNERIDCELRSGADGTEQLSSADANARIYGSYLNAVPLQSREYGRVGPPTADDLGKYGRNRRNRPLTLPHLRDQGANSISPSRGTMRECG